MSTSTKDINRKQFLQLTALTGVSLLPAVASLSKLFAEPARFDIRMISKAYRMIVPENMMNLEFYFINVSETTDGEGNTVLRAVDGEANSYMIVRLPQQHIAETMYLFEQTGKAPAANCNIKRAAAGISGYSYIAFRIVTDSGTTDISIASMIATETADCCESIYPPTEFSNCELLQWNDTTKYELIIREDIDRDIFTIPGVSQKSTTAAGKDAFEKNDYPFRRYYTDSADAQLFPALYSEWNMLTDPRATGVRDASPITLLELPYKIFLSPRLPDSRKYEFLWTFTNDPVINVTDSNTCTSENEMWMAMLSIKRREVYQTDINKPDKSVSTASTNSSMELMILGNKREDLKEKFRMLPTEIDANKIVALSTGRKLNAISNRLTFTPIGACVDIHLYNPDFEKTAKAGNDLVEWNQHISFGRDQKVEVSTLVIDQETAQKYIWTRCAIRTTYYGFALLKYEEYIESLDEFKEHVDFDNETNIKYDDKFVYRAGTPFKYSQSKFKRTRIKSAFELDRDDIVKDSDGNVIPTEKECPFPLTMDKVKGDLEKQLESVYSFRLKDPITNDHLEFDFEFTDWDSKVHQIRKKITVMTTSVVFKPQTIPVVTATAEQIAAGKVPMVFSQAITDAKTSIEKLWKENSTVDTLITSINTYRDEINKGKSTYDRIYKLTERHLHDITSHYEELLPLAVKELEATLQGKEDKVQEWVTRSHELMHEFTEQCDKYIGQANDQIAGMQSFCTSYISNPAGVPAKVVTEMQKVQNALNDLAAKADEWNSIVPALHTAIDNAKTIAQAEADAISTEFAKNLDTLKGLVTVIYKEILLFQEKLKINNDEAQKKVMAFALIYSRLKKAEGDIQNKIKFFNKDYTIAVNAAVGKIEEDFEKKVVAKFAKLNSKVADVKTLIDTINKKYQNESRKVIKDFIDTEINEIKKKLGTLTAAEEAAIEEAKDMIHDATNHINSSLSKVKVEYLILRGNLKKSADGALDFFDHQVIMPQLHTLQGNIKAVDDLVNKSIPIKIKYAEDYLKNQLDDKLLETRNNAAHVFAKIKGDTKIRLQSAMREMNQNLGGTVNVQAAADFLSYARQHANSLKETVDAVKVLKMGLEDKIKDAKADLVLIGDNFKNQCDTYLKRGELNAQDMLRDMKMKILGAIRLEDIVGLSKAVPITIRNKDQIIYNYTTSELKKVPIGIFSFEPGENSFFSVHAEKSLNNLKQYSTVASLNNFDIGVFDDRIVVGFDKVQIKSNERESNKVDIKIRDNGIKFNKELDFFKRLADAIKLPAGLKLDISPAALQLGYKLPLPGISGGAFNMDKLVLNTTIVLPLANRTKPVSFKISICDLENQFIVSVGPFGGKGFFEIEFTPHYISAIDTSINFGGVLYLNLAGIATGQAYLLAGIRYRYERNDEGAVSQELYALVTAGGELSILGIISISLVFLVYLRYKNDSAGTTLDGYASVTCSISVMFFKKSFTLSFHHTIAGANNTSASTGYMPPHDLPEYERALYYPDQNTEDLFRRTSGGATIQDPIEKKESIEHLVRSKYQDNETWVTYRSFYFK